MSEIVDKAKKIIKDNTGVGTHCVLALIDVDGYPTASTITASKAYGIKEIYFCGGNCTPKTKRIDKNNHASVCFNSEEFNITLVGSIEIITDSKVKIKMWYEGLANHFTGSDDPNYCVLKFTTDRYNLLIDWEEVRGQIN